MSKQVNVTVTLKIVVDAEAWDLNYGSGTTVAEITRDVRSYWSGELLPGHLMDEGTVLSVTETHKS